MTGFPAPTFLDTNGIRLAAYVAGDGPPVILCHGFPELAYSWRWQLPALAAAGYRAIALDLRGYGASDKPTEVRAYGDDCLCADLLGVLDALELPDAHFVGHDWGAILLWQFALRCPERILSLVNLNIPYYARPPSDPVAYMRRTLGSKHYIVNFIDSDEADRRMAADPETFLRSVMRRLPVRRRDWEAKHSAPHAYSMLAGLDRRQWPGEPLLDETELAVFVQAFRRGGFSGPINWYRNWSANWRRSEGLDPLVRVPTLFIGAHDDVLVQPKHIAAMRNWVPELTTEILYDCGHWTQQERPEAVNALLVDWLNRHTPAALA